MAPAADEVDMTRKRKIGLTGLAVVVVLLASFSSQGRFANQDPQQEPQSTPVQDPIARLRLTPEQRQKIRAIRIENRDERAAIGQRLKETNEALERALDAENPNEGEIGQRLQDLAAAQAASNRMRVLTELRIRRVLTREQIVIWRSFRLEAARNRRNEVLDQGDSRRNENRVRPARRNVFAPLEERRNPIPKNPHP